MAHKWPQNTFLLKVNNKTIGFSCIGKTNDTKAANEVIAIYLLKEYHGQKLGYTLLNKTVSMFTDNAKIVLWVLKGNDKAIHFYKRFGFDFNGNQKTLPFGVELQMELKRQ